MSDLLNNLASSEQGFLNSQLLIAMPGTPEGIFDRSVIYICAHSDEGAMGFILNQPQEMSFPDVAVQIGLLEEEDAIRLPDRARNLPVQTGGPVDTGRGFVLHTDDYLSDSTVPISDALCMTATIDILREISGGSGPKQAMMMLGYAGWASGQLENEIAANGWLTCPATDEMVFDRSLDDKYDRALASMGINPALLSSECGTA